MRTLLLLVGIVAILMGGLWAGQGAGYIHWPPPHAGQFTMVDNSIWIYYGGGLALVGLILVFLSRRGA
jgi:hypothetical protein